MENSPADKWYAEVSQIVDIINAEANNNPKIQETEDFLAYCTAFGRIFKHVLLETLTKEDVETLKNAATKVLKNKTPI